MNFIGKLKKLRNIMATKTINEKNLKGLHDEYCAIPSNERWDGELMRERYPMDELILHRMLCAELFYVWEEHRANGLLACIHDAYPEAIMDDLKRVYDEYGGIVTAIYG